MLSMYALILGFFQKYDKEAGVGTLFAMMLPYVVWMLLLWTLLFAAWYWLALPWACDSGADGDRQRQFCHPRENPNRY